MEYLTLSTLNSIIKQTISDNLNRTYWIIAEINQLSANYGGHAYLEFIEKQENSDKILAKSRATIWASTYRMVKPYFESVTGYQLKNGLKILVNVSVEFHEVYGLSLNVFDIDPTYTLGDLEKRKLEIIKQLKDEGIFDLNKELEFPELPQNIAIISSATAAGYEDFVNQLTNNNHNYKFNLKLFPAVMQGNNAEDSIISALDEIFEYEDIFDIVVIIRGGGSKSDLACFDTYNLTANICQFPIPIITGIGHERDVSIADIVAHESQKTPTAVAEFIISKFLEIDNKLTKIEDNFVNCINKKIRTEKENLNQITFNFQNVVNNRITKTKINFQNTEQKFSNNLQKYLNKKEFQINLFSNKLINALNNSLNSKNKKLNFLETKTNFSIEKYFLKKKNQLNLFEKIIEYQHPKNILKKGYSITRCNNKVIKNVDELENETIIETELYFGKIKSEIKLVK